MTIVSDNEEHFSRYLPALTGLRAVAAWLVFVHHFNPFPPENGLLHALAQQGYVGVSVFFVLSGFLLAYRYYDSSLSTVRGVSNYWSKRLIRIFPLLFLVVTGTFLVLHFAGRLTYENPLKEYLLNISLLKGFSDRHKFTGVAQSWSLTVEETFYLFLPGIIILHRRLGWYFTTFILVLISGYGLFLAGKNSGIFLENFSFFIHYTFWGHSWDFFAGFGLFILFKKRLIPNFRFPFLIYFGIMLGGIAVYMMALAYLDNPNSWNNSLIWSHLLLPIAVAVFMAGLIVEQTSLRRFLSSYFMQESGKASYAFYLLHLGVLGYAYSSLGWAGYFVFISLISWLVYRMAEKPLARYFANIIFPLPTVSGQPSPSNSSQ